MRHRQIGRTSLNQTHSYLMTFLRADLVSGYKNQNSGKRVLSDKCGR